MSSSKITVVGSTIADMNLFTPARLFFCVCNVPAILSEYRIKHLNIMTRRDGIDG